MEKDADLLVAADLSPALSVVDFDATPLAWRPAPVPGGCRSSAACPWSRAGLLRNLLAHAGGHLYAESGKAVGLASSRVLACHTRTGGRHRFRLPRPAQVVDATTDRTVLQAGTGFAVRLAPRSTAIWFLHEA